MSVLCKTPKLHFFFQISELLKTLAEKKLPPTCTICIDPRNISATLSILNNTGCTCSTGWTIRSKAALPENIRELSSCQFKRRDHLRESLASAVPVPAVASPQEGQLQLSSNLVLLAHLVEKSKMLPSGSVSSIGEQLKKQEIYPHILGVQAWTQHQSCELWCTPPVRHVSPQTGQVTICLYVHIPYSSHATQISCSNLVIRKSVLKLEAQGCINISLFSHNLTFCDHDNTFLYSTL